MHYPSRFPRRLAQISDRRVFSLALVAVVCAALIEPSRGQALSQRTITLVVGYAAGGTGDMVARVVARKLSEALGQSVTVDNRPGVSGGLATQSVARAKADGHTILVGQSAEIAINPHWLKGLSYKPDRDLQPIALGVTVPLGLVVSAKAPARAKVASASPRAPAGCGDRGPPHVLSPR